VSSGKFIVRKLWKGTSTDAKKKKSLNYKNKKEERKGKGSQDPEK